MNYTTENVQLIMLSMMNIDNRNITCETTINRHIRNSFGITADVVVVIWDILQSQYELLKNTRIKHVLWMLCYFKTYNEYEQYCNIFGVSDKTFRTWIWYVTGLVCRLDIVSKKKLFP
jgi:hypothetical protein